MFIRKIRLATFTILFNFVLTSCALIKPDQFSYPGNYKKFEVALKLGFDVNRPTYNGDTLLIHAIKNNEKDKFLLLIKHPKTEIDLKGYQDHTALYYAMNKGDKFFIESLLNAGAQYSAMTMNDRVGLVCQSIELKNEGYLNQDIVRKLAVDAGHLCPSKNITLAYLAIKNNYLRKILQAHLFLNQPMGGGHTPLGWAINNDPGLVDELIREGALVNIKSQDKLPLYWAFRVDDRAIRDSLRANGAKLSDIDTKFWVDLACSGLLYDQPGKATRGYIIRNKTGANVKCEGDYVFYIALKQKNLAILKEIKKYGADFKKISLLHKRNLLSDAVHRRYWKGFDFVASINKHQKLSSQELYDVINNNEGNQVRINIALAKATTLERHKFACNILKNNRARKSLLEYLKRTLNKNRPCEDGSYPIFYVLNDLSAFEKIINLKPKIRVKNSEGRSPIQVAIAEKNMAIISALAKADSSAVKKLTYLDVKPVADNEAVMKSLKLAGLPKTIDIGLRAEQDCNAKYYDSSDSLMNQKLYIVNWKLFQRYANEQQGKLEVLEQFRACLEKNIYNIDHAPVYSLHSYDSEPILRYRDFLGSAKIKAILGMSFLSPSNLNDQNPKKALSLINEAFGEIKESATEFKMAADRYIDKKKVEQEKRRRNAENTALFHSALSIAGGFYLSNNGADYNTASTFMNNQMNLALNNLQSEIDDINNTSIDVPSTVRSKTFDDDGVRLLVPRFGDWRPLGSLESHRSNDHTNRIVRLSAGGAFCTGAILGNGKIITAQHCILDKEAKFADKITIFLEYLVISPQSKSLEVNAKEYSGPWKVTTSKGNWMNGHWKNDWAIIEVADKRKLPKWLKFGLGKFSSHEYQKFISNTAENRISIAGYSSHLNEGKYLTMDWGCRMLKSSERILLHKCRGWKGDSGAPIVAANGPKKGQVLAVMSFTRGDSSGKGVKGAVGMKEVHRQQKNYSREFHIQ